MTKYIIAMAVGAVLASFSSQAATKFKDSSVLSSGKWVKIKVGETGVYEMKDMRYGHYLVIETVAPDGTLLKGVLTDQSRASTSIVMESPYSDAFLCKLELIRDVEAFLIQGYEDCKRIKGLESEIRALYPKYQEKLHELENESSRKKYLAFHDVYDELIGDVAVVCLEKLFNKWFGLEFKIER